MSPRIPEELIDQIRTSINIVDFIGQYVHLRKSGRSYMGLCPFHGEKTPSFSVLEDKQIFHCFGCGAGGNVFSFVMKIENILFPEAIQLLADRAGISLPHDHADDADESEEQRERRKMYDAYELVSRLYNHLLFQTPHGNQAKEYFEKRNIDHATAVEFQLGFAPESWDFVTQFLVKRGYDLALMQKAGLLSRREYDKKPFDLFRNRLMFPIADSQGRIIAFGGRMIGEGQPKYLNSPEHPLFNKSNILFNLHRARNEIRKKRQAILFEGYMDVIAAWQAGIKNGVASLGTSFTESQAKIIKRNADHVLLCYDSDHAGIEAAMKASEVLLHAECQVRIVTLEDGLDPDDYIKKYGAEAFQRQVINAISVTAFKMQNLRRHYDLSDEVQRLQYINTVLEQISSLTNAVERDHYLRTLAEEFDYSLDALKQEQRKVYFQQKRAGGRDKLAKKWNNSINNGVHLPVKNLLPAHYNAEKKLIVLMLHNETWAEEILAKVGGNFNVEEFAALAAHLYNYYMMGNAADPSKFISGLEDERLIEAASKLAVEEIPEELMSRELSDYIQQVLNYPILLQMEELKNEQRRLEREGDSLKAAQIGIQILQLRKSIKPVST
ncbi:DNA primase [Ammoniphilus sp. CFH 90114]|uniref:DNA primase n=1 Tax=Ammoniphilus sp. CFH 90114 TaxID=2493665 RepID=UPI00100E8FB8|nr:DNA primase [Ammoniphilus sp. CFH 90114]RXT14849.1 DNA primase [Ammoniphilus sp. CFH 90114]